MQGIPWKGVLAITLHLMQLQVVLIVYIYVNLLCGKTRAFLTPKILESSIYLVFEVYLFSQRKGLTLKLVNSCSESYDIPFSCAVMFWEPCKALWVFSHSVWSLLSCGFAGDRSNGCYITVSLVPQLLMEMLRQGASSSQEGLDVECRAAPCLGNLNYVFWRTSFMEFGFPYSCVLSFRYS